MWKLKPGERLARWRDFRKQLDQLGLDEAVQATADFWSSCPFTPYYLDPKQSATWPDPWQLIDENYYCDIAKCLGIVYTLLLTDHRTNIDFEIRVYYDVEAKVTYNLAWLNAGKYVLNLDSAEVLNNTSVDKKLKLQHCYTSSALNLDQY